MSAAQPTELHIALNEALASVAGAGQFRVLVLSDPRGLLWAVHGDAAALGKMAAVPALLSRAFADRQMLLRFFSEKAMRFEYRSDTLAHIRSSVEGEPADAVFCLDVPGDKESKQAAEFVLNWGNAYLVLRRFAVGDATWALLGVSSSPAPARAALAKACGHLAALIQSPPRPQAPAGGLPEMALHGRMDAALRAFCSAAPGIQMAAVTSKDGFVVATLEDATLDAEVVAPLMGHAFLAIQESTQVLCGATETVMLSMEAGILLARDLTDELLFAALLQPSACTGLILSAFETAAADLRGALLAMETAVTVSQEPLEVAA